MSLANCLSNFLAKQCFYLNHRHVIKSFEMQLNEVINSFLKNNSAYLAYIGVSSVGTLQPLVTQVCRAAVLMIIFL